MGEKIVVQNRRARREYHVLDTYEAGLELRGTEVKSMRGGHMTLKDSYVDVSKGELFLVNSHISPYEMGNVHNHEPERPRKLLMHRREIDRISSRVAEKGLTLVPLKVYFKKGRAKVEIGLCRGKQTIDKRRTIQEREAKVEIGRALKDAQKR